MQSTAKLSIILPLRNCGEYAGGIIEDINRQVIKNWECIIVDRASDDGTRETVRELIAGNDSFELLCSDSEGFGAACNMGLEEANGRYIAFCGVNDRFDAGYFERLYNTAFRNKADLAIGSMEHLKRGVQRIDPLDPELVSTLTTRGKLFRKKLVLQNGLRFEDKSCASERDFYLSFCAVSEAVFGCRGAVCVSRELPVRNDETDPLYLNTESFGKASAGLDKGLEQFEEQYNAIKDSLIREKGSVDAGSTSVTGVSEHDASAGDIALAELDNRYERLKSALHCSFAREILIDGVLRRFRQAPGDVLKAAAASLEECRVRVFPHEWTDMIRDESRDLSLNEEELTDLSGLEDVVNITFVISGIKEADKLNEVIESIYYQNSPQFEVLVHDGIYDSLSREWKDQPNLRAFSAGSDEIKKTAYGLCRSKYVWFIDRPAYLSESLAKDIYNYAERNTGLLFVSVPLYRRGKTAIEPLGPNAATFVPEFVLQKRRTAYNQLDFVWVNKLINIAKLDAMEEPFRLDNIETLDRFYRNSRYHKNPGLHISTDFTERDILDSVKSGRVRMLWKHKLAKEERFLARTAARDEHKDTIVNLRRRWWNAFFRFMSIKVIYPLVYHICSIRPVDPKKVIIVEPAKLSIDGNLASIKKGIDALGGYKVKVMCLGRKNARKRLQLKRESQFIKELATARFVFTDEVLGMIGGFNKRKGTDLVQLWHGCGAFKQFGYSTADYLFGGDRKEKDKYPGYRNTDLITVSSPEVIWAYQEAMGYKGTDVVKATGVSRTDVFYDEEYLNKARDNVRKIAPEADGKKLIIYAPTFRGTVRRAKAPSKLDIRIMKEALGSDYFLLVKHHPYVKVPPAVPEDCTDFAKDVSTSASIDDLIACGDFCISDYSSLVFEYSIFERPMIFLAYDIEDYDDWRGFYYDYEELTPGPVVYDTEGITEYIKNIDTEFDRDEVIRFRNKFMSACDGHATERILKTIGMQQ